MKGSRGEKLYMVLVTFFLIGGWPTHVAAVSMESEQAPNLLVVYSSENGEVDEHQRLLDMLLGHFSDKITFKASTEVKEKDVAQADYLFYYGQQREALPGTLVELITKYDGVLVALGHNAEQLGDRFSFIEWTVDPAIIDRITVKDDQDKQLTFIPQYLLKINVIDEQQTETLFIGKKDGEEHPLFVRNRTNFYFASTLLKPPFTIAFAEMLHEVFTEKPLFGSETNLGYIRLEDIHPLVDPDHLMKIAHILAEKKIPYMIAVIPVYTNPVTQKQSHFSDSPKLLKALKFMQDNGGSIVLHGYTHQFRLSETGEGFEFWDVEHNMPIYHDQNDEVIVKTRDDFTSDYSYEQYIRSQKEIERAYIVERITKGVQELANYGLYPLAFEAPHYTMSQNGYKVLSDYFSTYVGQLQLSDEDWEIMSTAPYVTMPTFLHGMKLLPETLGFIQPESPKAIETMIDNARNYQFVRDGMVAGFYHPYLGVDLFIELLKELEKIPNVTWIDLKEMNNRVQTDYVDIKSENGEIIVDINRTGLFMSSFDYVSYHLHRIVFVILWMIAAIGSLAVITFFIHAWRNYSKHQPKRGDPVG